MKLKPTKQNFKAWVKCVPMTGDLVFLKERYHGLFSKKVRILKSGLLEKDPAWPLNNRSWYGYALARSNYCAWLSPGDIEKLPAKILEDVGMIQAAIKVQSLIKVDRLPEKILKKLTRVKTYAWITSLSWKRLSQPEKEAVIAAWFSQNKTAPEETIPFARMPAGIRKKLKDYKLEKLLNTFRNESGGNCFAAAAGFAAKDMALFKKWVLWAELKNLLRKKRFKITPSNEKLRDGDILVFSLNGKVVHAAIYLGAGIYFEKAGQDFYEPYRAVYLKNWKKEWPKTTLAIFRR